MSIAHYFEWWSYGLVLDMLVSFVGDRATQLLYTPQLVFIVDRYSKQWQKDRVSDTIMFSRSCLFYEETCPLHHRTMIQWCVRLHRQLQRHRQLQ